MWEDLSKCCVTWAHTAIIKHTHTHAHKAAHHAVHTDEHTLRGANRHIMSETVSDPIFVLLPDCALACERACLMLAFVVHIFHPEFLVRLYFQHRQSVRHLAAYPKESTLIWEHPLPVFTHRTLISCSSIIWMFQPLRTVGNHVVRSCVPSIQTRRSGQSGPRRSWSVSSSPCVSIERSHLYSLSTSVPTFMHKTAAVSTPKALKAVAWLQARKKEFNLVAAVLVWGFNVLSY